MISSRFGPCPSCRPTFSTLSPLFFNVCPAGSLAAVTAVEDPATLIGQSRELVAVAVVAHTLR